MCHQCYYHCQRLPGVLVIAEGYVYCDSLWKRTEKNTTGRVGRNDRLQLLRS